MSRNPHSGSVREVASQTEELRLTGVRQFASCYRLEGGGSGTLGRGDVMKAVVASLLAFWGCRHLKRRLAPR